MADKLNYVNQVYYNTFLQKYNPRVWFKLMSLNLDLLPYYDTKLLCKPGYYTSIQLNKSIADKFLLFALLGIYLYSIFIIFQYSTIRQFKVFN